MEESKTDCRASGAHRIILGTAQFGLEYGIASQGRPDRDQVFEVLDLAYENGIRLLDTAHAYGNASQLIGDYHAVRNHRFEVMTKFHGDQIDAKRLIDQVRQSLETMKVSRFHTLLYHDASDLHSRDPFAPALSELKNSGLIQRIGLSIYDNQQMRLATESIDMDVIQLPFNLLDNARQRGDLITRAKAAGKIIHTRSVFLQGLFFRQSIPQYLAALEPHLNMLRKLSDWAQMSLAQLALNYVAKQSSIDGVLVGVDNARQLSANLVGLGKSVPEQINDYVDSIAVSDIELLDPSCWNQIRESWESANRETKRNLRSVAS